MSDDIKELVDAILGSTPKEWDRKPLGDWGDFKNKAEDFSLKQEVLPEGSAIVEETITEVSVIDLKGNHFKFPGNFRMERIGDKIKLIAY